VEDRFAVAANTDGIDEESSILLPKK